MTDPTTPVRRALADPQIQAILGDRLRSYREAAGLTQVDLSRRAGLSPLTLQKAEHGGNFTIRTLLRVLRALGRLEQLDTFLPPPAKSPLDLIAGDSDGG